MALRLTLCHPAALSRVAPEARRRWAYTDSCLREYAAIEKKLGQDGLLCSPRKLQRTILDMRGEFVAWVDYNLSGVVAEEVLLSPLSRHPFHDLFLQLVWLKVIAEALSLSGSQILIVTSSRDMVDTLRDYYRKQGGTVLILGKGYYKVSAVRRRLRSWVKFVYLLSQMALRMFLSRVLLGRDYRDRLRSAGIELLVDSYLYAGDVSITGEVNHRYFPGLLDWYREQGQIAAYLPILYRVSWRALPMLYRGYRNSSFLFVPTELYLLWRDLLLASVVCLRQMMRPLRLNAHNWSGMSVGALVSNSRLQGVVEGVHGLLMIKMPQRLREAGIPPNGLLDWFENQPIDQGVAQGMRKYLPQCRHVAIRQYTIYSGWPALSVTTREVEQGVVPSEHWVCGRAWMQPAAEFDSVGQYRVVPALRYAYLHEMEVFTEEGRDLLVLLTVSVAESAAMLSWVGSSVDELCRLFPRIRIKPHPTHSWDALCRSGREIKDLRNKENIILEERPIAELFPEARLVFSAGSSAALEAVALGIPVLHAGRTAGIDLCPLEHVDERLWRAVFSAEELLEGIIAWSPSHPILRAERISLGRKVSRACFEPVTKDLMKLFSLSRS